MQQRAVPALAPAAAVALGAAVALQCGARACFIAGHRARQAERAAAAAAAAGRAPPVPEADWRAFCGDLLNGGLASWDDAGTRAGGGGVGNHGT